MHKRRSTMHRSDSGMLRHTSRRATNSDMSLDIPSEPQEAPDKALTEKQRQKAELQAQLERAAAQFPKTSPGQQQTREQREFSTLVKQARDALNFVWGKLHKQSQAAIELLERAEAVMDDQREK